MERSLSYSFKKLLFSKREPVVSYGRSGRERERSSQAERRKRDSSPFEEVKLDQSGQNVEVSVSELPGPSDTPSPESPEIDKRPRENSGFEEIRDSRLRSRSNRLPSIPSPGDLIGQLPETIVKKNDRHVTVPSDQQDGFNVWTPHQKNNADSDPQNPPNLEKLDAKLTPEQSFVLSESLQEELGDEDISLRPKAERYQPLTKEQYLSCLDGDGRIVGEHDVRRSIFKGGVEVEIRREVWQFLYELYPCNSTTREREIMKTEHRIRYQALKARWRPLLKEIAKDKKSGVKFCPDWFGKKKQRKSSNNSSAKSTSDKVADGTNPSMDSDNPISDSANLVLDSSGNSKYVGFKGEEITENEHKSMNPALDSNAVFEDQHNLILDSQTSNQNRFQSFNHENQVQDHPNQYLDHLNRDQDHSNRDQEHYNRNLDHPNPHLYSQSSDSKEPQHRFSGKRFSDSSLDNGTSESSFDLVSNDAIPTSPGFQQEDEDVVLNPDMDSDIDMNLDLDYNKEAQKRHNNDNAFDESSFYCLSNEVISTNPGFIQRTRDYVASSGNPFLDSVDSDNGLDENRKTKRGRNDDRDKGNPFLDSVDRDLGLGDNRKAMRRNDCNDCNDGNPFLDSMDSEHGLNGIDKSKRERKDDKDLGNPFLDSTDSEDILNMIEKASTKIGPNSNANEDRKFDCNLVTKRRIDSNREMGNPFLNSTDNEDILNMIEQEASRIGPNSNEDRKLDGNFVASRRVGNDADKGNPFLDSTDNGDIFDTVEQQNNENMPVSCRNGDEKLDDELIAKKRSGSDPGNPFLDSTENEEILNIVEKRSGEMIDPDTGERSFPKEVKVAEDIAIDSNKDSEAKGNENDLTYATDTTNISMTECDLNAANMCKVEECVSNVSEAIKDAMFEEPPSDSISVATRDAENNDYRDDYCYVNGNDVQCSKDPNLSQRLNQSGACSENIDQSESGANQLAGNETQEVCDQKEGIRQGQSLKNEKQTTSVIDFQEKQDFEDDSNNVPFNISLNQISSKNQMAETSAMAFEENQELFLEEKSPESNTLLRCSSGDEISLQNFTDVSLDVSLDLMSSKNETPDTSAIDFREKQSNFSEVSYLEESVIADEDIVGENAEVDLSSLQQQVGISMQLENSEFLSSCEIETSLDLEKSDALMNNGSLISCPNDPDKSSVKDETSETKGLIQNDVSVTHNLDDTELMMIDGNKTPIGDTLEMSLKGQALEVKGLLQNNDSLTPGSDDQPNLIHNEHSCSDDSNDSTVKSQSSQVKIIQKYDQLTYDLDDPENLPDKGQESDVKGRSFEKNLKNNDASIENEIDEFNGQLYENEQSSKGKGQFRPIETGLFRAEDGAMFSPIYNVMVREGAGIGTGRGAREKVDLGTDDKKVFLDSRDNPRHDYNTEENHQVYLYASINNDVNPDESIHKSVDPNRIQTFGFDAKLSKRYSENIENNMDSDEHRSTDPQRAKPFGLDYRQPKQDYEDSEIEFNPQKSFTKSRRSPRIRKHSSNDELLSKRGTDDITSPNKSDLNLDLNKTPAKEVKSDAAMPLWLAQQLKASSPSGTRITKKLRIHEEGLPIEEDTSHVVPVRVISEQASLAIKQKLIESRIPVRSSTPVEFDKVLNKEDRNEADSDKIIADDIHTEQQNRLLDEGDTSNDVTSKSHDVIKESDDVERGPHDVMQVADENFEMRDDENDIQYENTKGVFSCDVSKITETKEADDVANSKRVKAHQKSRDDSMVTRGVPSVSCDTPYTSRGLRKSQSVTNINDFRDVETPITKIRNSIKLTDSKISKSDSNICSPDERDSSTPLPDISEDGHVSCPYCGMDYQDEVEIPEGFGEDWRRSVEIQAQVYAGRQSYNIEEVCQALRIIDKDVPRTDRELPFFSGNENRNLLKLRDALISYSFFHPEVGYAQGMNDVMSRFFVVMESEADAYWMFCNYMEYFKGDFMEKDMLKKINMVEQLLMKMDRELYDFLQEIQMELIFCHRWLLLSFKREFSYEDGLRIFEIMSSRHLEMSSIEAEMERSRERARELEKDEGSRLEEIYVIPEYSFDVFLCVAMLHECRDLLMSTDDMANIYQTLASLPKINDLNTILAKAEDLFYQYCRKSTMDCFQLIDEPIEKTLSWKQRLHSSLLIGGKSHVTLPS